MTSLEVLSRNYTIERISHTVRHKAYYLELKESANLDIHRMHKIFLSSPAHIRHVIHMWCYFTSDKLKTSASDREALCHSVLTYDVQIIEDGQKSLVLIHFSTISE